MGKSKMVLGLFAAFVLGCAATQLAPLVVPPARAGSAPQKWEYSCIQSVEKEVPKVEAKANTYGQQGWEMSSSFVVSNTWLVMCFKRSLPPAAL